MSYPDEDFKAISDWTKTNDAPFEPPTPLHSVLRFIAALASDGKSASTIEHRVFGVSAYNVAHGHSALAKTYEIKTALRTRC
jgi:hypothetical protein